MIKSRLIKGYKGVNKIPCEILVKGEWYTPKGSSFISKACNAEHLKEGIWVLEIADRDYCKTKKPVNTFSRMSRELANYRLYKMNQIELRRKKFKLKESNGTRPKYL